jgi:hypothetical protein
MIDNKTSLLIPSQLPEFVRDSDEYKNFNLFLNAYYEWLETINITDKFNKSPAANNQGVTYASKNLLNYNDIDSTIDDFIDYYTNDFLQYFPKDILISKQKAIKFARELYQSKGTISSYKFLFKILYNSDFDVFFTRDAVLRASAGEWYIAKSLKLSTTDSRFLNISNYRIIGETTKSIATIETSVLAGNKIEVFISNIERLFQSGEFARIVNNLNQDVYINGSILRAKIVGQINQINIDASADKRGLLYQPGDPVVVYGGLSSNTSASAKAEVSTITKGAITSIKVVNGGYGFPDPAVYTGSNARDPLSFINISDSENSKAAAHVAFINSNGPISNIANVPINSIFLAKDVRINNTTFSFFESNGTANSNTTLANAFTFVSYTGYPISSVYVDNGGGGISKIPTVTANSTYTTDYYVKTPLQNLGILGPILIINGGNGYRANDQIVFSGGSGRGARANVLSVNSTGAITSVSYVFASKTEGPLGGSGYRNDSLPTLSVNSANAQASNASLYVPSILGTTASFSLTLDRTGSITTISVLDAGEDYIAKPNVSLKIQDILVSNVYLINLPQKGDLVYQGSSKESASVLATVDSITSLTTDNNELLNKYNLRIFDYTNKVNTSIKLNIDKSSGNIRMIPVNSGTAYTQDIITYTLPATASSPAVTYHRNYGDKGTIEYGDGTAKATATFLNGLVVSQGQYLNTKGQASSYDVLQSDIYNNFTYQITVEKEIEKYRDILYNLLHPAGMKVIGRYALRHNNVVNTHSQQALLKYKTLEAYTGYPASNVRITTNFTNKSNNIVNFYNLLGAQVNNFVLIDSTINMVNENGFSITSEIVSATKDTVKLKNNVWLTYANVAYVSANANSNVINILSLTGSYDYINNKNYSNTSYPLKDIVYAGDSILIGSNVSNSKIINSVDYVNGLIYLQTNANITIANTLLSVNRNFNATSVKIYGAIGQEYIPQLTAEDGTIITTEDGAIITLG